MAWYDGKGSSVAGDVATGAAVGALTGGIVGPATAPAIAAAAHTNAGKAVGKQLASWNPYAKGPTYQAQNVQDAPTVTAPTFDPNALKGPGTVAGPTSFTGATIGGVGDPRAVLIDQAGSNEWRAQQQSLAQQLALQASGQGPSLATEQLNQAQKANQAAAFAQLASQRGGPSAAGARSAQMASAQIQGQTARDAATARIQEQMAARQQLGGVLESGRGADIQLATQQAMMQQEAGLAKYKGDLERAIAQGQLDQQTASQMFEAAVGNARQNASMTAAYNQQYNSLVAQYAAMGMSAAEANQAAALQVQQMRLGEGGKAQQSQIAASEAQKAKIAGLINQAAGVGATLATGGANKAAAPAAAAAAPTGNVAQSAAPGVQTDYSNMA